MLKRWPRALLLTALLLLYQTPSALGVPGTIPGVITSYSTIYSIGVEWDITGDDNHNAAVAVRYRIGAGAFSNALPLIRVDNAPDTPQGGLTAARNMLAGSVFFLQPNTTYEVELVLSDPDGGASTQTRNVTTRRLPTKPAGGNTYYVSPGAGGGSGTQSNPFLGLAAAQTAAVAGDIIKVNSGSYGTFTFSKSGASPVSYIVWENAGGGASTLTAITISGSYVWLEGFTFGPNTGDCITGSGSDVVISRNTSVNCHGTIDSLAASASYWYIADNVFDGDTDPLGGSFSGEGVDMNHTIGHTIAHNDITQVGDGISYPLYNIDIFGNDIHNTSDDCIELDYAYPNVRVWGNRCQMSGLNNGIAFQPHNIGPAYLIRNQVVLTTNEGPLKLIIRESNRAILFHNTFVNILNGFFLRNASEMLKFHSRNNLYIAGSAAGSQIWNQGIVAADWRSDLNYDGFDWGAFTGNPFTYLGVGHATVAAYAAASGQENNGLKVVQANTFESTNYTSTPRPVLSLKTGATAIDVGEVLPNINDDFLGTAPDLGAHEFGAAAMQYGPRAPSGDGNPPAAPTSLRLQ